MVRKLSLLLAILLVSACFGGCNDVAQEKEETDATEQSTNLVQEPPLDELRELADSSKDSWGLYESILAFLSGDAKSMVECEHSDEFVEEDYEDATKIKFTSYEITEREGGDLDFKFTVSESESERFPVGEYHYLVSVFGWKDLNNESKYDKYEDVLESVYILAGHGCTAWENGEPTYDDDGLDFDFSVVRTIQWYVTRNGLSDYEGYEGRTEDYAKFAEKLFGIKDFVPQSEYLKLVDGKWQDAIYINIIDIGQSITDIRQNGDKIEIDIQYFADSYGMVPAHSVTVYVTKTDDDVFKYYFEKSVVTETGKYKPRRWSV